MNSITKKILPVLIAALSLMRWQQAGAQSLTILHNFAGGSGEGSSPYERLLLAGNRLYGTTHSGGAGGTFGGTIFAMNLDGTGFTNLHSFFPSSSDGSQPRSGLVLAGDTLYGVANSGGSSSLGTIYRINTNGTGFTNFFSFTGSTGGNPWGTLLLVGGTLYGTTFNPAGSVFAVSTNGTGYTNLHVFATPSGATNVDGQHPEGGVILAGDVLYGTASAGGFYTRGTIFAVSTNGTFFTNLHNFIFSDGANPLDNLVLSGNTLYGVAGNGGANGQGTLFAINTNGTGFTNIHAFDNVASGYPEGGVMLIGDSLYGTASSGGTSGNGTLFMVKTNGTAYTNLYNFSFGIARSPYAAVILSSNILYGTASLDGSSNSGAIFAFALPRPVLTMQRAGDNVTLRWTNHFNVYNLLGAPAVTGTYTNIPGATSPYTNAIPGAQQFFRLIAN